MTIKLSNGAVQLLDVIEKMPGHFREDYCKVADLSRSMWNKLSGELRRTGRAHTVRTTTNRNGREVTDFKWYAGSAKTPAKPGRKGKTPPLASRKARKVVKQPEKVVAKTVKSKPRKYTQAGPWTQEDLDNVSSLWKEGKSDKEISAIIGRTAQAIRTKRKQMRWVAGKGRPRNLPVQENVAKETTEEKEVLAPMESKVRVAKVHSKKRLPTIDDVVNARIDEKIRAWNDTLNIMDSRITSLMKRVNALEESLSKNEKSDDDTKNTLGDIKKTLSGLLDKL